MRIVRNRSYARAALVGNPSDGYHGKTIALLVRNFWAETVLYEWDSLEIVLASDDRAKFSSVQDLARDVTLHGYYGGIRLVKATIKRFVEYCRARGIELHDRNFSIRYETRIPRQVGMAGSSAIIVATLRSLMEFYGVTMPIEIQPAFGALRFTDVRLDYRRYLMPVRPFTIAARIEHVLSQAANLASIGASAKQNLSFWLKNQVYPGVDAWSGEELRRRMRTELRDSFLASPAQAALQAGLRELTYALDAAVRAAETGFRLWSRVPPPARGEVLRRVGDLLSDRKEPLARAMTQEMGKILTESRGDVQEGIDTAYYAASEGRRLFGRTVPSELRRKWAMSYRRPIGVAGLITPFNFPMAIPTWKMFPALLCGNAVVFKPSEDVPHTAHLLVEILLEAGLPPEVIQLVHGLGEEVGAAMVEHPGIPVISFTGSTGVGATIGEIGGRMHKRVSLEMGGKNAQIVMPDADGGTIAAEIKADPGLRNTPVVFLTALVSQHVTHGVQAQIGGHPFLAKPVDPDVVLECVGHETPFTQAIQAVRPGGTVSSVGVYVEPSMGFPAREAFFKDLTLKMGICNARNYMAPLLPLVRLGKLRPARIITHTMPLAEAPKGYAIFDRKEDRAIKVMLKP